MHTQKCIMFAELPSAGTDNLRQVERLYIEFSGKLNVLRYANPKQAKSIIAEWDKDFIKRIEQRRFFITQAKNSHMYITFTAS
jgi:hypothetical protein